MLPAECPQCENEVPFRSSAKLDQKVTCPNCSERLIVIAMRPIVLDYDDDYDNDEWDNDYEG